MNILDNRRTSSKLLLIKPTITENTYIYNIIPNDGTYIACPVLWIKSNDDIEDINIFNYIQLIIDDNIAETLYPETFPLLYNKINQHIIYQDNWIYFPLPFYSAWNDCIKGNISIKIISYNYSFNESELQVFNINTEPNILSSLIKYITCINKPKIFEYTQTQYYLFEREITPLFNDMVNEIHFIFTDLDNNIIKNKIMFNNLIVKNNNCETLLNIDESRLSVFRKNNYYILPLFSGYGNDAINFTNNSIIFNFEDIVDELNTKIVIIGFSKKNI